MELIATLLCYIIRTLMRAFYPSIISIIFILLFLVQSLCNNVNNFERGESSFNFLRSKTDESENGSCMKESFSQLNATCANLDDTMLNYLALRFTICHFQTLKREFPEQCVHALPSIESVAECTKNLSEITFSIYTQFYTHTRASCYFLESKLWQEKTHRTISRLGEVADFSANLIEQSLVNSDTLIKGQAELYAKASQLSDKHDGLHDKMDTNHQKMDELTQDINKYYNMVYDMLSLLSNSSVRLEQMLSLVMGESQQLSSFLFYFTLTLMTFLLTMPSRTNAARLKMLSFIVLHFILERLSFSAVSSFGSDYISLFFTLTCYTRFFTVLMSLFLLVHTGYNHRDYETLLSVINTKLDEERSENKKFREIIQKEIKVNNTSLHEKFDTISRPFVSQEDEQLNPRPRSSIHRARRRLEDSFDTQDCINDYSTPWGSRLSGGDSSNYISSMFSPVMALDYDSGVDDCSISRKELQLSIHKLDVSTAGSSPASTPSRPSQPITASNKRYFLRSQHK